MRLKRVTRAHRDFGSTWDIWSESFVNYVMIVVESFSPSFPSLCRVLLFHTKIRKLSKVYEWQGAVLALALGFHTEITTTYPTDVDAWTLVQAWADLYCSPHTVLAAFSKKQAANATQRTNKQERDGRSLLQLQHEGLYVQGMRQRAQVFRLQLERAWSVDMYQEAMRFSDGKWKLDDRSYQYILVGYESKISIVSATFETVESLSQGMCILMKLIIMTEKI